MFKIESLREEEAKTLSLSENLFHEALKYKPESRARFHVKNNKGEDSDVLAQMRKEFGKSMAALSQHRISVSDLKDGQIIGRCSNV